jgi:hypothetical protein
MVSRAVQSRMGMFQRRVCCRVSWFVVALSFQRMSCLPQGGCANSPRHMDEVVATIFRSCCLGSGSVDAASCMLATAMCPLIFGG